MAFAGIAVSIPALLLWFVPETSGFMAAVPGLLVFFAFSAIVVIPLRHSRSPLLGLLLLLYVVEFGLRSIYLFARPNVTSFPSFVPERDWFALGRGLTWAGVGMLGLALGYAVSFKRNLRTVRVIERSSFFRSHGSAPSLLLILYTIGWIGRFYAIRTGSNLYLFNSPSFDQFAIRNTSAVGQAIQALTELCPLAFAAIVITGLRRGERRYLVLAGACGLLELGYFCLGLYKFGLFSIPIMIWIAFRLSGTRLSRAVVPVGVAFVVLVVPVINEARSDLLDFNKARGQASLGWVSSFSESASRSWGKMFSTPFDSIADPIAERINGPEALAVATKGPRPPSYTPGGTYLNVPVFLLPGVLRPASWRPSYIPWETSYVGYSASSFNVVPMPTVVEGYINFGLLGAFGIMFLFGSISAFVDKIGVLGRVSPLVGGWYAYTVWRLSNIEHNVFIYLVPVLKITGLVIATAWIFGVARNAVISRPARRLAAAPVAT